ncbi:MAG: DoxX family protein [Bacteroidetes bacterium]|nr:DoxX family protein [Bacteroidota bacterium]
MKTLKRHIFSHSTHVGLLILRLGIGIQFLLHGYPKLTGGVVKWEKLGSSMEMVGMDFYPAFWGFMAAFAEFFGGLFLLLGWFTRPSALLLSITMLIATIKHVSEKDATWMDGSHSFELMVVFIAIYFTGSGKYSLDEILHRKN